MILFFTGPSLSSGDDLARWQEANQEAHALLRKGEFEQAIKSWNMALDAVEPDNREVGEILYWVGEAHWRNTDLLGAENSFAQWVAWTREHGSDTELSRALSTLAAAQERAGNFEDAYRLRTENVEILEKRWPPGFILASAHWQLARHFALRGMDKEAELRYQLALHKLGPDRYSIYEAEILEGYAELLHERERGNDAEAVRKLAAAIRGVPPDLALQLRQEAHRIELGLE